MGDIPHEARNLLIRAMRDFEPPFDDPDQLTCAILLQLDDRGIVTRLWPHIAPLAAAVVEGRIDPFAV